MFEAGKSYYFTFVANGGQGPHPSTRPWKVVKVEGAQLLLEAYHAPLPLLLNLNSALFHSAEPMMGDATEDPDPSPAAGYEYVRPKDN